MKVGGVATLVACSGVVVPFLMGWGILMLWGAPSNEAIFVGASMVATSVGITAQVLSAKGLLHTVSSQDHSRGRRDRRRARTARSGRRQQPDARQVQRSAALALTAVAGGRLHRDRRQVGHAGDRARSCPHVERKLRVGEAQFAIAMSLLFALVAGRRLHRRGGDRRRVPGRPGAGREHRPARARPGARRHRTAGALLPRRHRSARRPRGVFATAATRCWRS